MSQWYLFFSWMVSHTILKKGLNYYKTTTTNNNYIKKEAEIFKDIKVDF
jgi:predicted transcriptional regulator with HTH domain